MNDKIVPDITGKIVFGILLRYKYIIIACVLIMTIIFGIKAYLKHSVYRSSTTIKLTSQKNSGASFFAGGLNSDDSAEQDAEIRLIQSSLMIDKVLKKLELGTRYFYNNKYKTHELYKDTPFIVQVISMEGPLMGKKIYIQGNGNNKYILSLKDAPWSLKKVKKAVFSHLPPSLAFSQEYEYGEEITTKWFKIVVHKMSNVGNKEHFFTYVPNKYMGGMISGGLNVSFDGRKSLIFQISYEDTVPLRAQEIVNAVTQTYFEDEVSEKLKAANKTLSYLDNQLAALTKILNKSASKLKSFKQTNTDVTLNNVADSTSSKISEAQARLREIEFDRNVLGNLKLYIDNGKDLSSVTIAESEFSNKSLIEKLDRYQVLTEIYRKNLTIYTEFHPEVIKSIDDINRMKQNIKYLVDNNLQRIKQRKEFYKDEISALKNSLVSLPQKERKLASLSRNFAVNEKIYSFLLEKRTEMQILHSSTTANIRILDEASVPGASIRPRRMYITFMGAILGFVIGATIALLLYFRDNTIKNLEEVENAVSIPFYGLVPYHEKGKYTIAYEEAFRTLRTNLEFAQVSKSSKTILVASAISGEGKSTTIKNIAEMLVKINRKVIVLDFDLRRPSLHSYFNSIGNTKGLSTLISGQNSLSESLQKTVDGIDILTAGPIPPNPSELIMSEGTDLLLQTLGKTYDYILIDTPPYSVVTDASILMKKSDVVLFSLMVNHSKRESISGLKDAIKRYELDSAGIVYHGLKLKKKEQHGYGYFENQ